MKRGDFFRTGAVAFVAALTVLMGVNGLSPARSAPDRTSWNSVPRYEVLDLGLPRGAVSVQALGASPNSRYVVGFATTREGDRAFIWNRGKFRYLASIPSAAWAVNDAGKAVGETRPGRDAVHAVVWSGGRTKRLFPGNENSHAHVIDSAGNIFGTRVDAKVRNLWRAYRRRPSGATTYPIKDTERHVYLCDASENGQMILYLIHPTTREQRAVLWDGKSAHDLPSPEDGKPSYPQRLNRHGDIVGLFLDEPTRPLPVIWKNRVPSVPRTPNIRAGIGTGINEQGDIIGSALIPNYAVEIPFLIRHGKFYNLKCYLDSGEDIRRPLWIGRTGIILASGRVGAAQHAFLLRPLQ